MNSEGDSVDDLKREIERLNRELAQTSHEKIQSAQYGLVLLDEKESLQHRCEEIELQYESAKNELELVREALAKFQTSHKVTTTTGVEQEECLLQESATREASLNSSLLELERELKLVRLELERCVAEKERLSNECAELFKHYELAEWEKKSQKSELRELKFRETRLLTDYSELEEENIGLQKQVSALKSSQVGLIVIFHLL
ncbi:BICD1 (predicted) [Pycnogonum litorale]